VEKHTIPFVAIGGIKRYNLRDVTVRGASLIALVTEITGAENPAAVIREIDKILEKEFADES
jgi:thiamine-phosphate pyrophosphorylase